MFDAEISYSDILNVNMAHNISHLSSLGTNQNL